MASATKSIGLRRSSQRIPPEKLKRFERSEFVCGLCFVVISAVAGTALAFAFLWFGHSLSHLRHKIASPISLAESMGAEAASSPRSEAVIASSHPITTQGVHGLNELLNLIHSDPAIAEHYRGQGFDLSCAHTEILNANTWAHVSYRTDGGFAFTARPILILQGEQVIADCRGHLIRSACGNLSAIAEKSPEQVPTEAFAGDLPFENTIPLGLAAAPVPPAEAPTDTPIQVGPPIIIPADTPSYPDTPILCCIVGGPGAPVTPVAAPENSSLSMIAVGCALLFTLRIPKRRVIQSETLDSQV
jgi:hypothetical protein